MGKEEGAEVLTVAGREVRVTNPSKPYFTKQAKLSKLDIVHYYLAVAGGAHGRGNAGAKSERIGHVRGTG